MSYITLFAAEQHKKKIDLSLTALEMNVRSQNDLGLFDINHVAESFFARFLSIIYDLNLVNLNIVSKNYPAIDLGDRVKRFSIQITSDGSKTKVSETIEKFLKHGLDRDFDRVQVVVIGKASGRYAGMERASAPSFDPKTDVISLHNLRTLIKSLPTPKLHQLSEIIDEEMPIMEAFVKSRKPSDAEALKEYRAKFNRRALQDPWHQEGSVTGFSDALHDLINLLHTGVVKCEKVTKRFADFDDEDWQAALEDVYHKVRALLGLYTAHVRTGEIDEVGNLWLFSDSRTPDVFNQYKQIVIDEVNNLLVRANIRPIRGVGG